jgi:hypothetical protein
MDIINILDDIQLTEHNKMRLFIMVLGEIGKKQMRFGNPESIDLILSFTNHYHVINIIDGEYARTIRPHEYLYP